MPNLDSILHHVSRPARYTGGEWNCVIKDWDKTALRLALIYPDTYELGMSNMALPILYDIINRQPDALAERAFAPWVDMEKAMREQQIPLFSLESKHPLREFDVLGFSLGYELTYTNVLNMLDLSGIPVMAEQRDDSHPLVIAGGSGALNPEPMSDFIDLFVIGEGEEVMEELLECLRGWKQNRASKKDLLRRAAGIDGVYVPSLYRVEYNEDNTVKSITPASKKTPPVIRRRILSSLPPPPLQPVVPFIEVVHDRAAIEIQRGCTRGCRFCQAGFIYRPLRERPQEEVIKAAGELINNCGYEELSLVSLTTSDYPGIATLVTELTHRYPGLTLSLPSLRINEFSVKLVDSLPSHRKTGLTLAPEAGSERLRNIINKNIPEEELLKTAATAFDRGWVTLKLYFMIGLPFETMADVEDIARLVHKVDAVGLQAKGRRPQMRVSVATFVPKPHTPFQWVAQAKPEEINSGQEILKAKMPRKGTRLSWSDPEISLLEAVLSRGDRRLGKAIYTAWQAGCTFDAWSERFNFKTWLQAFDRAGIDPAFYAYRQRSLDEVLPWSHISTGVSVDYLKQEYQRALAGDVTPDCRTQPCNNCGIETLTGGCPEAGSK